MGQRVDFSANASIYDRRHGAVLTQDIAHGLRSKGELPREAYVLDVGGGTGRVAITFASIGYKIVALDPALAMLKELRRKAPDIRIQAVVGKELAFPSPPETSMR